MTIVTHLCAVPTARRFRLKLSALAILSALNFGCDSGGSNNNTPSAASTEALTSQNTNETQPPNSVTPDSSGPQDSSSNADPDITPGPEATILTGKFIDSPVANLKFSTPSGNGRTNESGEFYYKTGEQITFSIGELTFPAITARETITPLDLYSADSVVQPDVKNLARLLQTLDTDNNPDNGIVLPDAADRFNLDQSIVLNHDASFESTAIPALQGIGINTALVGEGEALTHLSNSLLQRGLIDISQTSSASVQFDASNVISRLPDFDADGIADAFDWDDDGDGVADYIDMFPQDVSAAFDIDGDGIGNSLDTDDDNDGVPDVDDTFPLIAIESIDTDNDGYGNNLDTDDDNDGVPDIFDAYPLDPLEQLDTDNDGIGNETDTDDDGDDVLDRQDAFPLLFSESQDTDNDGLGNNFDQDDDNDGVPDTIDHFPTISTEQLDTDNDGTGNNADTDDDNDGYLDTDDAFPLLYAERIDTDNDGLGDNFDLDDDGDGAPDIVDQFPLNAAETLDTDNDGIGNNADEDDDGDGIDDSMDPFPLAETNASDLDGDGFADNIDDDNDNDGVHDALDVFPNDSTESSDNDKDGIGDNADPDDDNDGTPDADDALPLNPAETSDSDNDGIGDNADNDSDNDGVEDSLDEFPLDDGEHTDTDGDGIGNNADDDDDDDGVSDAMDAFPLNPYESADLDGDGIGDNSDYDRDNDGIDDYYDDFPDDPLEYFDNDGDGVGDNADTDDDNDGTPDVDDPYPNEAYYGADTDGDGDQDQWDYDDDNDGVDDSEDALPKDATESQDTDADGIGNNADPDDDNDGVNDTEDSAPLDSNCSSAEDSFGGICSANFVQNVSFVEQLGDSVYLFSANANAAMQVLLSTEEIQAAIDLSTYGESTITAAKYIPSHDRIYVGYADGVVVYIDVNSTESTYFHTLPNGAKSFAEAGNFVLAQTLGWYDDTYVLDTDGIQVSKDSYSIDDITTSAWSSANNTIYYEDWGDSLYSRAIDQTDGSMTYGTSLSASKDITAPLKFSPDNSLLLSASGQTFLFNETPIAGGILTNDTLTDFSWNEAGELLTIHASSENTIVKHYTTGLVVAESLTIDGTPLKLLQDDSAFYVITDTDTGLAINSYIPSPDSDNDLVLNVDDAFPTDPAASVDSDNDGSPDSWNVGYSEADSTSNLVIDAYPSDPACYLSEDGNGEHCFYDLIIPVQAPTTVVSDDNLTYIYYVDEPLLFVRDNATDTYLKPIPIGEDEGTQTLKPTVMALHKEHNRLYFGYVSGLVNYIDLNSETPAEQYFTTIAESVLGIAEAGEFVMFVDASGAWESHHYYDIEGVLTESKDWNQNSSYFAWSSVHNRLYFFRDGSSPNDLLYEEVSAQGLILSGGDSPYHGDYGITGPIIVSPDQSNVLLGASEYYDSITLERIGSLSRSFEHATYLDDGRLAIVKKNGTDTIVAYYDTAYAPIAGVTTFQGAEPVGIAYSNNVLTVVTYSIINGLEFHDIDNP